MKHIILLFLLFTFASYLAEAQILKGKITSESGDPIQYATVYIQELKQGTTANTKGDYEIKLPLGKYLVIYQSLGFSPVYLNITLSDQTIIKDVILPVQLYEIPEVRISATGEDPAIIIMRKAIGLAPYYLNNISYYKANVYLKGNLLFNRIPRLLQKSMKIEASNGSGSSKSTTTIKEGDSFFMESYNEIEFTAPDKYFQKVISINSTFPDQGNEISPMDFIQASFYQPVLANLAISPLSPQAFSHYNFKYMGASLQGNNVVNKIEVRPKRKSQQLFEGTIYIIEDLWCLHSVDLTNDNIAGKIRIQQLYIPVQDDIWMPVSHKFEINIGIIGLKADVQYGSSVKYLDVKPNLTLKKPESLTTNYFGRPVSDRGQQDTIVTRNQQEIEKILEKDEISNHDMIKLSRLMDKESERILPDSTRKNLEIKDKTTKIVEKDANKKDSAYWAEIRPIPLSDIEMKSVTIFDSLQKVSSLQKLQSDTIPQSEKQEKNKFLNSLKNLSSGHTWSDTNGRSFTFGGFLNLDKFSFNTVDGFIIGTDFRFSKTWKNHSSFSIYPEVRWAFSREKLMWRINGNFAFDRMKNRQVFVRTGITSKDISTGGSINTLLNTVSTLFLRDNYLKLYETRYFTLGYRSEIVNGLNLEISTGFEDRRVLDNTTDYSVIKSSKLYSDNIPDNDYLAAGADPGYFLRDQRHANIVTNVTYTPKQRYSIYNDTKALRESDWPTFNIIWKHIINETYETTDRYKHFDLMLFQVYKRHTIGAFSEFRYMIRTGGYSGSRDLTFYDFFHFNPQPLLLLLDDYQDAFMLPGYYSLSTPEFFGEAHIKYTTPYLLVKFLPGLSKTLMRENLSLAWLGSRNHSHYTEIGYSISEFLLLGEIGVYAGFEDLKYKSIGAKIVLRFN
jgi:hypothetical protein